MRNIYPLEGLDDRNSEYCQMLNYSSENISLTMRRCSRAWQLILEHFEKSKSY